MGLKFTWVGRKLKGYKSINGHECLDYPEYEDIQNVGTCLQFVHVRSGCVQAVMLNGTKIELVDYDDLTLVQGI